MSRILIGCEFSQVVCAAFRARGHEAYSCDLLPTEGNPEWHIQDDVLRVARQPGWDGGIFHPPCTYISAAGLHLCRDNPGRARKRDEATEFVISLFDSPIPQIALENPVGWLSTHWRKPSQIIYMNDFGHPEARKPTCLWLKNLPPLMATMQMPHRKGNGKRVSEWFAKTRNPKLRSITFAGVAEAMADQWSFA